MSKKSITLMEILIGALLISLVFGVLIGSFVFSRAYLRRANERLVAMNLGRSIFDKLNNAVNAASWNNPSSCLYPGNSLENFTIDGIDYKVNKTVLNTTGDFRMVIVNISYPSD